MSLQRFPFPLEKCLGLTLLGHLVILRSLGDARSTALPVHCRRAAPLAVLLFQELPNFYSGRSSHATSSDKPSSAELLSCIPLVSAPCHPLELIVLMLEMSRASHAFGPQR